MSEPKPTYNTDPEAPEHQTAAQISRDQKAYIIYLEQRRRALITELRAVEEVLEMPQSIPSKKR
jgi:hypothetical protein